MLNCSNEYNLRHHFKMSPRFSLQKPYVVASLPRPIDHINGRYVVGDVYGGAPGSKKRKRSELAVGVDGEGVNLYDVRNPSTQNMICSNVLPDVRKSINYLLCFTSANVIHLPSMLHQDSTLKGQG